MVLLEFLINGVLPLSLCITLYFVDILYTLRHISWYHFLSLSTSNSSWLIWAFFVVLDILYLLVHSFLIGFALISSSYLEYKSFLSYRLYYYFPMPVLCLSLVSRSQEVNLTFRIFSPHFYFLFDLFSFILFLELGLELERWDHAVTQQRTEEKVT